MKKFALFMAAFMLTGALIGVCACSVTGAKNSGKVEGDFTKEATTEEIEEAAKNIELSKAFGERKEDWKLGLELSGTFDAKIDLREENAASFASVAINAEGSGSVDYVVNLVSDDMKGSGFVKFKLHSKDPDAIESAVYHDLSYDVGIDLYNDRDDLYAKFDSLKVNGEDHLAGGKTPDADELEGIFEELLGGLGEEDLPSLKWMEETGSLADLLETLRTQYGAKVYLDASEGVRVKVSFDAKRFLGEFLQFISNRIEPENFAFTKDTVDVYFAFDEGGMFKKLGFDLNLQASLAENSEAGGTLFMKGRLALIASSRKAVTPKDLASYPYVSPISMTMGSATPPKEEASHVIIETSAKADGLSAFTSSIKDGTMFFAPPKGCEQSDSDWLKYSDDTWEDLSVSFQLVYEGDLGSLSLSIEGLDKLLPYLGRPHLYFNGKDVGFATVNGSAELPILSALNGTITVTAVFSWGERFDGKNPFEYFNAMPYSLENAALASELLLGLDSLKSETVIFAFTAVGV